MRRKFPELHKKSQKKPRKAHNRLEATIKRRTRRVRRHDETILLKPSVVLALEEEIAFVPLRKRILKGISKGSVDTNTPFLRRRIKNAA